MTVATHPEHCQQPNHPCAALRCQLVAPERGTSPRRVASCSVSWLGPGGPRASTAAHGHVEDQSAQLLARTALQTLLDEQREGEGFRAYDEALFA